MNAIPCRIIQTAKSRELPPLAKAAVSNLTLLHPDWEYLFFDDDDRFVASEFPQYQQVFRRFPHPIQRFDVFRYLAVLRFGGFYFDLNVLLSDNISQLNSYGCIFPFEELTVNLSCASTATSIGSLGTTALEQVHSTRSLLRWLKTERER